MGVVVSPYAEELPPIGSSESAVRTAVNLIAGMAGQPEVLVERWLDLYYQVRLLHEHGPGTPGLPIEYVGEHTEPPTQPKDGRGSKSGGNHNGADAAAFKRATRDRLMELREKGLSTARILELSNGAIKDAQLMDILEARNAPVNVYRVLAAVLDKIEET